MAEGCSLQAPPPRLRGCSARVRQRSVRERGGWYGDRRMPGMPRDAQYTCCQLPSLRSGASPSEEFNAHDRATDSRPAIGRLVALRDAWPRWPYLPVHHSARGLPDAHGGRLLQLLHQKGKSRHVGRCVPQLLRAHKAQKGCARRPVSDLQQAVLEPRWPISRSLKKARRKANMKNLSPIRPRLGSVIETGEQIGERINQRATQT